MENPAPFDLNERIRQWRRDLANSPALGDQDLDELEAHLRDAFEALQSRGVAATEAFETAVRRLGTNPELQSEFAKVNPEWVWSERALWIMCGVLASNLLWALVSFFSNVVLNLSVWHGFGPHTIGALHVLTSLILTVALLWLGFRLVVRHAHTLYRAAEIVLRKPVWAGLALIIGLEALQYLPQYAIRWLEPLWQHIANAGRGLPPDGQTIMNAWLVGGYLAAQVLWLVSLPYLAAYAWRKRHESPVWPQRAICVVVGIVLARLFTGLVLDPSSILLVVSHSATPLVQHLAGLGAVGLCLGVIAAILLVSDRAARRYPTQWNRVSRLCCERPFIAAILLVAACAAVGALDYLIIWLLSPAQRGISPIGGSWLRGCGLLAYVVTPTVLLLWLARRRQARLVGQSH